MPNHPATSGELLNIGDASSASGISVKMIRHYESIGLIAPAQRTESGYRVYAENEVHTLRFINAARDLGFSVDQIKGLLELWRNRSRASADVKAMATDHIAALREKICLLGSMVGALSHLADHCHGDDRPDCPILEGFEQLVTTPSHKKRAPFGATR